MCVYSKRRDSISGGPVVKTSPSNAGGAGSIPGQGTKEFVNIVTNSIKIFKMVHIKKILKKKKGLPWWRSD